MLSPGETTLYIRWALYDDTGIVEELRNPSHDKVKLTASEYTFSHDGTLYINVANGHNYGNSSSISVSDMTATIKLYDNAVGKIDRRVSTIEGTYGEVLTEVRTQRVNETVTTTTTGAVFYYPMDFVVGQRYIAKVTFTAFTSSTSGRKWSLRTTDYKSLSTDHCIQVLTIVEGTNPTIGQTYEFIFTATQNSSGKVGKYITIELAPTSGETASCTLEAYSVKAEDVQTELDKLDYLTATDIVSLNHDVSAKVNAMRKPLMGSTQYPLGLLHFSDIHANATNLARILEMAEHLGSKIQDVICTGDMASNNYAEGCMDFWDSVDGAENILMVVGNHDLADGTGGYSSDQIGQTVAYETYFAPYISNWGVTSAGENLTYWHKDYSTYKVRLIGLNYLLTGDELTAQNTWLAERLAEAKTAGYAVVIAEHAPMSDFTQIDCSFSIIGKPWTYDEFPTSIQDVVQSFIDGGGEFACYLCGHSHSDYVGYNLSYPHQLCIAVTTALVSGANDALRRTAGEKSQDAANVVLIDTVTKTVKLVRVGADRDLYGRKMDTLCIRYTDMTVLAGA